MTEKTVWTSRRALLAVLETADGPLRIRRFAVPAVAQLLRGSGPDRDTPQR